MRAALLLHGILLNYKGNFTSSLNNPYYSCHCMPYVYVIRNRPRMVLEKLAQLPWLDSPLREFNSTRKQPGDAQKLTGNYSIRFDQQVCSCFCYSSR